MNQYDSEAVMLTLRMPFLFSKTDRCMWASHTARSARPAGRIVFATGMTGYQETLTDPSYDRQIVVQTFPHIGDTGINGEDPESSRIWVAGYVVRDPSPNVSNWRATGSLDDDLESNHIVGISHIDTRKLVRHLRSAGVMRAAIFSGDALLDGDGKLRTIDSMLDEVKATPQMKGMSLYDEVSTKEAYTIEPCGEFEGKEPLFTVAAVDLGIKSMTPHRMAERGCRVHVVPSTITFDELQSLNPDGVFFSNGPGDPEQADPEVNLLRQVLDAGYPFFGICFGNQLLGRALGFGTYKLKFGHRGINQPVKDMTTGKNRNHRAQPWLRRGCANRRNRRRAIRERQIRQGVRQPYRFER